MTAFGVIVVTSLVLSTLLVHHTAARQIRQALDSSTIKTPANLSVEELMFILKTRNGEEPKKPKHLTPCARAILSCCSEKVMNPSCSESLQCGAYFFDDNPCEDKFLLDALKNARAFYEQWNPNKKQKS